MKIQSINNNQNYNKNVTHKAYFKPNNEFKILYGKNSLLPKNIIAKFKDLPNHQLEIISVQKTEQVSKQKLKFTIFNQDTLKTISIWAEDRYDSLANIMSFLSEKDDVQMNFFAKDFILAKDYDKLTNP